MNPNQTENQPQREFPTLDAAVHELKRFLRSFEPAPDVAEHFRNARIEMLKGMRQILDNRIEELNRRQQSGGTKIVVE
jgi:hypothetical protein